MSYACGFTVSSSGILHLLNAHGEALYLIGELGSHGVVCHATGHEVLLLFVGLGMGIYSNVEWSQPESLPLANMGRTLKSHSLSLYAAFLLLLLLT